MPMCTCSQGCGGEKESVSSRHFLVVVPQPISFCILNKQANCSAWFIFPCLIHHFLAKRNFHSSIRSLQSCRNKRLMKMGTWPLVERWYFLSSHNRPYEMNIRQINIHVLLNLHWGYTIIGCTLSEDFTLLGYNMYAVLNSSSFMSAYMTM